MQPVKTLLLCGVALVAVMAPAGAQQPAPMSTAAAADLIPHALIRRDTFGVPHITADTDEAAAFAMGYAVAEDHAVEMGKLYLIARGDAARWFGPAYLDGDLTQKRMGNLEGARRALEVTGDGYRRWLHGFVTGVNFYAEKHRAEFELRDAVAAVLERQTPLRRRRRLQRVYPCAQPGGTHQWLCRRQF